MLLADILIDDDGHLLLALFVYTSPCSAFLLACYCGYVGLMHRTLLGVKPHNRRLHPYVIWLLLIPLFNLAWYPYVVHMLAKSLKAEFRERGLPVEGRSFGSPIGVMVLFLSFASLAYSITASLINGYVLIDGMCCSGLLLAVVYGIAMFVHFCIVGFTRDEM